MAPAPSDCSRARSVVRIRRGISLAAVVVVMVVVMLGVNVVAGELGMRGAPVKVEGVAALISVRLVAIEVLKRLEYGKVSFVKAALMGLSVAVIVIARMQVRTDKNHFMSLESSGRFISIGKKGAWKDSEANVLECSGGQRPEHDSYVFRVRRQSL